jgi:hypothetical protein
MPKVLKYSAIYSLRRKFARLKLRAHLLDLDCLWRTLYKMAAL